MMWFLFLFGLALAAEPPSDGQELKLVRGSCPLFWFSFQGRCYKYFGSRVTWGEAELHCVSEGANLVSIHSLNEQNFVNLLIKNFDPTRSLTWIGLTDMHKEGGWIWSDGNTPDERKIAYTNTRAVFLKISMSPDQNIPALILLKDPVTFLYMVIKTGLHGTAQIELYLAFM
uniref:C-type lectin domain-containing protein n=1 Tax=Poecilia mexicana TaxID=48701 RepID=A0A3B3XW65_9TELE